MSWRGGYGGWAPYVPVARRRANATSHAEKLAKKEKRTLSPVKIDGTKIAKSFWGKAWCENLERYSDYANRLPRGRTYVRNGSVIDLQIEKGQIKSLVSGSEIYEISIKIETLPAATWAKIKRDCSQSIDSLLDLLQGKFDRGIMERLTQKEDGLFPRPKEIKLSCSCPDSASLCKHIAATMYGVANRLDSSPELLFRLREVDHLELISAAVSAKNLEQTFGSSHENALAGSDLGELFGIEMDPGEPAADNSTSKNTRKTIRVGTAAKKAKAKKPATEKRTPREPSTSKAEKAPSVKPARAAAKRATSAPPPPSKTRMKVKASVKTASAKAATGSKVAATKPSSPRKSVKPIRPK